MRGMSTRLKVNIRHPVASGVCDFSGFVVPAKDLVEQLAYTGNGVINTGLKVYKKFADQLNPQNLAFEAEVDPVPALNPRPYVQPNLKPLVIQLTVLSPAVYQFSEAECQGPNIDIQWDGTPLNNEIYKFIIPTLPFPLLISTLKVKSTFPGKLFFYWPNILAEPVRIDPQALVSLEINNNQLTLNHLETFHDFTNKPF